MFATLRTEDRDGEVVCISSTHQLPQPGQNTNHFACDGCRAKKLKCTGHRFGCQRCRDRNLACTYSNTLPQRRRKGGRPPAPHKSATPREITPSTSEEPPMMVPSESPQERLQSAQLEQLSEPKCVSKGAASDQILSPERAEIDMDSQSTNLLIQTPTFVGSGQSPSTLLEEESSGTPPDFEDLALPDYMESDLHEFDMDDLQLLDAEINLSEQEAEGHDLSKAFASSTTPFNVQITRETSFARSSSSSDDSQWNAVQRSKSNHTRDDTSHDISHDFVAPKRAPSSLSSHGISSTVPFTPHHHPHSFPLNAPSPLLVNRSHGSQITGPGSQTSIAATAPCRCVGVTLNLLEKMQTQSKVTTFCMAETSLHLLKKSITQCRSISHCSSCRNRSRVMTFSILLAEKIMAILEDIASVWECASQASNLGDDGRIEAYGHAHRWIPVLLGQYQIDTFHERCEIFGFLILLQVGATPEFATAHLSPSRGATRSFERACMRRIYFLS
ncbi:uncharacterized protein CCOS01_15697 [Colletotrichum costaricense]|uniref:Zn(2)-C6 fungal-type domain-containing protein n=1 Tax=Colletotrichum costaricense TaxID=1209916 RepID=A0AAI9YH27_9PEZI|nr:uncharacterized protein CCOS01_15697 [Colletotrichum costaricense]KAK1509181.1 hypothetical protein CCOS01_15697 [Colletotrichum costaricense]